MGRVTSAVPRAVPSSVAPSTGNSVSINEVAQRSYLQTPVGQRVVPEVPRPEDAPPVSDINPSPTYGGTHGTGMERESGSAGAPSVPNLGGVEMYIQGTIDPHYQNEFQGDKDPYAKINNPATRGMFTWVKDYLNGIATSQDVDNAGFKMRHPQQRTSHMRITPPPHGGGYAPETAQPHQTPQTPNTYKYMPQIGTQPYGSGQPHAGGFQTGRVLNSDTYGAGQTAGGIGGNNYTPTPGPPDTNSTAGTDASVSGMPMWG